MRNILTQTLPLKIQTENGIFEPVTDFRAGIEFEVMVEKGEQDIFNLMKPFYPNGLPEPEKSAIEAAIWFYMCGGEEKEEPAKPTRNRKKAYSFTVDAEAIYSDFSRYYNIDLTDAKIHWWKFRALLYGLPNDSAFKERIYYRTCDLKNLSKNEKKRIAEIRKHIEIKTEEKGEKITLEQRNKQILDYVSNRTKGVK